MLMADFPLALSLFNAALEIFVCLRLARLWGAVNTVLMQLSYFLFGAKQFA